MIVVIVGKRNITSEKSRAWKPAVGKKGCIQGRFWTGSHHEPSFHRHKAPCWQDTSKDLRLYGKATPWIEMTMKLRLDDLPLFRSIHSYHSCVLCRSGPGFCQKTGRHFLGRTWVMGEGPQKVFKTLLILKLSIDFLSWILYCQM